MIGRARGGRAARFLAIALLVSACSSVPSGTVAPPASAPDATEASSTTPPMPPPTAWSRALAAIGEDGQFSLAAALTLFATAYGPLPGVDVEQDLRGVTDRTIAIRAVMAHRDELTAEQRAAVDRALEVPAGAVTITIPAAGAAAGRPLLAGIFGAAVGQPMLAAVSNDQQEFLRTAASAFREQMAARLGRDFLGDIELSFLDRSDSGGADADAWSDWPGGVFGNCRIRLYLGFDNSIPQVRQQVLAHEVFHCFQLDAYRTIEGFSTAPAWVVEGQAEWVAAALVDYPNGWWIDYLQLPQKALTKRAYDAIGFYAHLAETGTNPWSVFQDMWQAGSNNTDIYLASRATSDAFLDSVASAVVLLPNLGEAWTTRGAGMVEPEWGYRSADISIANGGHLDVRAPIFTNDIKTLRINADMVHITYSGHARLADGVIDTTVLENAWFCVEGHTCESTCPGEEPAIVLRGTLNPRFLFAVAGGLTGTTASIKGVKFERPTSCQSPEPSDGAFCIKYRDYVAWVTSLGPDAEISQAVAAGIARRFDDMYPVAPDELRGWVMLVWQIYATFAGVSEPVNIPATGNVAGIDKLPQALRTMHAYCGIPWAGG